MTKKKLKIAVTLALSALAAVANAQTSPIRPAYQYPAAPPVSGAAAIQVPNTPLFFTPFVGLAVGHDDNLFQSSTNETESALYITSLGFRLDARSPNSVFQLSAQSQVGHYSSSSEDNYVDHTARAQLDMAFGARAFARVGYDFIRGHDPRGSTDRAISPRPDRYQLSNPNATFAFGAPGAQGRFEAYYQEAHKRYLNNRDTTFLSDRTVTDYGAAFYWRVMPRTYLLAEVRQTDLKYKSPLSPFNGEEQRIFGGVTWEATAATVGTLKVGRLEKEFDNSAFPSFSGTSWEGVITWAPRTYSTFDFYGARTTNESSGLGSFILSDIYGATWNHAWSSVLNSAVLLRHQRDEYQGFNRTDETKSLGFKVGYRFRRWLILGAEWTYTQRDSNLGVFEYDRNLYFLTATASM